MQLETTSYMCGRTFEIALYPVLLSAHALQVSAKLVSCWARSFEYLSKLRYHSGFYHLNKYGSWTCICLPVEEFIFWTFIVFQRLVAQVMTRWFSWWADGKAAKQVTTPEEIKLLSLTSLMRRLLKTPIPQKRGKTSSLYIPIDKNLMASLLEKLLSWSHWHTWYLSIYAIASIAALV